MKTRPVTMPIWMLEHISMAASNTGMSENEFIRQSLRKGMPQVEAFFGEVNGQSAACLASV
jgi:hypothetical protein